VIDRNAARSCAAEEFQHRGEFTSREGPRIAEIFVHLLDRPLIDQDQLDIGIGGIGICRPAGPQIPRAVFPLVEKSRIG
jgi:hypothetical protein